MNKDKDYNNKENSYKKNIENFEGYLIYLINIISTYINIGNKYSEYKQNINQSNDDEYKINFFFSKLRIYFWTEFCLFMRAWIKIIQKLLFNNKSKKEFNSYYQQVWEFIFESKFFVIFFINFDLTNMLSNEIVKKISESNAMTIYKSLKDIKTILNETFHPKFDIEKLEKDPKNIFYKNLNFIFKNLSFKEIKKEFEKIISLFRCCDKHNICNISFDIRENDLNFFSYLDLLNSKINK